MEVRTMNIKQLREQHNMTQEELAKRLGVKPPAVSKWERGFMNMRVDRLVKLADLFGVSTDEVLGRK